MNDSEELLNAFNNGIARNSESGNKATEIAELSAEYQTPEKAKPKKRRTKKTDKESAVLEEPTQVDTTNKTTREQVFESAKALVQSQPDNFRAYVQASDFILDCYFDKKNDYEGGYANEGKHLLVALEYIEKAIGFLKKYKVFEPEITSSFIILTGNETEKDTKEVLMHNRCLLMQYLIHRLNIYLERSCKDISSGIEKTVEESDAIKEKVKKESKKAIRPQGKAKILYIPWVLIILGFICFFVNTIVSYVLETETLQNNFIFTLALLSVLIIIGIVNSVRFKKTVKAKVAAMSIKNKYLYNLKLGVVTSLLEIKKDYDALLKSISNSIARFFKFDEEKEMYASLKTDYTTTVRIYDGKREMIIMAIEENDFVEIKLAKANAITGIVINDDIKAHKFAIKRIKSCLK